MGDAWEFIGHIFRASELTLLHSSDRTLLREAGRRRAEDPSGVPEVALSALDAFLLGAFAKTVATMLTYPLVRIKTIIQARGRQRSRHVRTYSAALASGECPEIERVSLCDIGRRFTGSPRNTVACEGSIRPRRPGARSRTARSRTKTSRSGSTSPCCTVASGRPS